MRLKNQIALITGSSRGIGKGIAKLFAEEGATVIINGISAEIVNQTVNEFLGLGLKAYGSVFDTTDRKKLNMEIDKIEKNLGSISILVNNAGISPKKDGKRVSIADMDYEEWVRVMDVNINGVFNCSQRVIPRMIEKRQGKIINLASAFVRQYSPITASHYITSKTAVVGFTHALCGELASYGINCNAIAPGRTWTEMVKMVSQEENDAFQSNIPMGRFADVKDIANTALFLASEESGYINGATLDVNGGYAVS